jgi:hypothetical protein
MSKLQEQSRANGGTYNTNQFSSIDGATMTNGAGETNQKYHRGGRESDSEDDDASSNMKNLTYHQGTHLNSVDSNTE